MVQGLLLDMTANYPDRYIVSIWWFTNRLVRAPITVFTIGGAFLRWVPKRDADRELPILRGSMGDCSVWRGLWFRVWGSALEGCVIGEADASLRTLKLV